MEVNSKGEKGEGEGEGEEVKKKKYPFYAERVRAAKTWRGYTLPGKTALPAADDNSKVYRRFMVVYGGEREGGVAGLGCGATVLPWGKWGKMYNSEMKNFCGCSSGG